MGYFPLFDGKNKSAYCVVGVTMVTGMNCLMYLTTSSPAKTSCWKNEAMKQLRGFASAATRVRSNRRISDTVNTDETLEFDIC